MDQYFEIELGDEIIISPIIKGKRTKMQTTIIKEDGRVCQECKICEKFILEKKSKIKSFNLKCGKCSSF